MSRHDYHTHPAWEPPRFFTPRTLAEVMRAPLVLKRQPFNINPDSPTPLDPYRLKIEDGLFYDESARLFMQKKQLDPMQQFEDEEEDKDAYKAKIHQWTIDRLKELEDEPNADAWASVSREIQTQHLLKERRNDAALELLREDNRIVSPDEAERIMQVRAGVAQLPTMLRFLAVHPEIGGLELMKATRPFNPRAIWMARFAFMKTLGSLDEQDIAIELRAENTRRLHIVPDKEFEDVPDPRIVVQKTNLARIAVELDHQISMLEVVWRDSGVVLGPQDDEKNSFGVLRDEHGDVVAHVAPIAVTAYARLAPEQ